MDVILLEKIENLGMMGDVVSVKPGYGRNYLLPQEKALRASKINLARFEAEREYLEQRNEETRQNAVEQGKGLEGTQIVLIRKAGDAGNLYGSVTARDIADELKDKGVKRSMVVLEPVKFLGIHDIKVRLHPEVIIDITVNVARSEDEAERQAKGEDVIGMEQDEAKADAAESAAERAEAAVNMFEGDAPEEFSAPESDAGDAEEPKTEE